MGTEYIVVNLDKKEFLDFDRLGFGTKAGNMISEPIASFLSWLLINPEGFEGHLSSMVGRWAGDRIEMIGDEGTGWERQESVRKDFQDVTVEAIRGFAECNPFERVTKLQPMGLIDQDGRVVVDPESRESVRRYWTEVEKQDKREIDSYLAQQGASTKGDPAIEPEKTNGTEGTASAT